jgi:hypothetical protein
MIFVKIQNKIMIAKFEGLPILGHKLLDAKLMEKWQRRRRRRIQTNHRHVSALLNENESAAFVLMKWTRLHHHLLPESDDFTI